MSGIGREEYGLILFCIIFTLVIVALFFMIPTAYTWSRILPLHEYRMLFLSLFVGLLGLVFVACILFIPKQRD